MGDGEEVLLELQASAQCMCVCQCANDVLFVVGCAGHGWVLAKERLQHCRRRAAVRACAVVFVVVMLT